ncbi:MAG: NTP transferase domain-containing protein [Chloroflexi bacterium]|nr:NTP transferase domain-containing protein [Chloroflexota bacterium]
MTDYPPIPAVVTAGCSPNEHDPLAALTQGGPKALLPVAGQPMITHVVNNLVASRYIDRVVIVGMDPDATAPFATQVTYLDDRGGLVANYEAGLRYVVEHIPWCEEILLSSSDIPTIVPGIVDQFINTCRQTTHDLYYPIVERSVMESRFPGSHRSYLRLAEGEFAGGDILLASPRLEIRNPALWRDLADARKSPLKQARKFGLFTLLKLARGRLSLREAEQRVSQVLGIHGRVIPFEHAEIAMDVDKPFQLDIVRADIESRFAAQRET